jgi:2-oxoglutarate dehydrogenase E2 component (dihydrolipoamide succinyltransferase)
MGESVTEGSITGWRKAVGDRVEAGEPLVDVTTDKVDVEVPAPVSGTLARILVDDGATVAVGAALAEIDTGSDGAQKRPAGSETAEKTEPPVRPEPSSGATPPSGAAPSSARPGVIDGGVDASPLAKRQARGLAVSSVAMTSRPRRSTNGRP